MGQRCPAVLRLAGLCLLLLLLLLGGAAATTNTSSACYGDPDAGGCIRHHLTCDSGTSVFVLQALRFFDEDRKRNCPFENHDCTNFGHCCTRGNEDCFVSYPASDFVRFFSEWDCWHEENCLFKVPDYWSGKCSRTNSLISSGYSEITYACIADTEVKSFTSNSTAQGPALALQYESDFSQVDFDRHCLVEAADCSSLTAGVTMVMRNNYRDSTESCTRFGVNETEWLPCDSSQQLRVKEVASVTTPFLLTLQVVGNNDCEEGWLVLYTRNSAPLHLSCGASRDVRPACTDVTTETAPASSISMTTLTTTQTTTTMTTTTTNANAAGRSEGSAASSSHTGAIVGGVLAALLAVVAVLLLLFFLRKRRALPGPAGRFLARFKKQPAGSAAASSSSRGRGRRPRAQASPPGQPPEAACYLDIHPEEEGGSAQPVAMATQGGHDHSDYNHLGNSRAPAPSRDVTYGHLAATADVTEDDYDHVTRGQRSAPGVLDNPYDVARPGRAAGSGVTQDYDVTSVTEGNRIDVIGSPYDSLKPRQ